MLAGEFIRSVATGQAQGNNQTNSGVFFPSQPSAEEGRGRRKLPASRGIPVKELDQTSELEGERSMECRGF